MVAWVESVGGDYQRQASTGATTSTPGVSVCLNCGQAVQWLCSAHSQCLECQGPLEGWVCMMCAADIRVADDLLSGKERVPVSDMDWDELPY